LHQLEPNKQRNGFYSCGSDEEKGYEGEVQEMQDKVSEESEKLSSELSQLK
jgi:hypothetical protein